MRALSSLALGLALGAIVVVGLIAAPNASFAQKKDKDAARATPNDLAARLDQLAADVEELKKLGVEFPTIQRAVTDLAAQVAALRQDVDALSKAGGAQADLVTRIDVIDGRIAALAEQVGSLRASVQAAAAPEAHHAPAGSYDDGFLLSSDDGRFTLRTKAFVQVRYSYLGDQQLADKTLADGTKVFAVTESTFLLRRARIAWDGTVYSPKLTYAIQLGFDQGKTEVLDYYFDVKLPSRLVLRAGQFKVPFSMQAMQADSGRSFLERSVATDEFRYDRDLGVMLTWRAIPKRFEVIGGVFNGAGRNAKNDNVDPLAVVRVQGTPLGDLWAPEEGDIDVTPKPALRLGAGMTFENAPEPSNYLGSPIDNPDVDMNGRTDNVRVLQLGVDAALRVRGLGVEAEGFLREEGWGGIPDGQTTKFTPDTQKLGGYLQASYFVIKGRLQLGARVAYTEVDPLFVGGARKTDAPKADRDTRQELSVLGMYHRYRNGVELGGMYSYIAWGKEKGANPSGVGEHRLLIEAQVAF